MLKEKNYIFLIFTFVLATLVSAYIIEYGFGYKPCKLCIYERIPYFLSIFLLIEILFFKKYKKITLLLLSLIFISSAILAFYHVGIEKNFFNESLICTNNNLSEIISKEEILKQLSESSISCKDVNFKIMGLSLASINLIFSLVLSVIFVKLFINYGKN
jgi:disulfide bond formation protein DsbB